MRVWVAVAAVVAVGLALGVRWWLDRSLPPAPSLPADIEQLDPAVVHIVRTAHERVEQRPGDATAWIELGLVYHGNEMWPHAAEAYEQAAAMSPDDARVLYHLAEVRHRSGDVGGAIDAMTHAAQHAPDYAPAHWRLGLLLTEMGRIDEAAAAFERAIQIDPLDAPGRLGLARVLMIRGEYANAIEALELIADSPQTVRYADYRRHLLGSAYRGLQRDAAGEVTAAASHPHSTVQWADAWQMEPRQFAASSSARLDYAMELGSAGRFNDAIAVLHEIKSDTGHNAALIENNLSMLYRATGDLESAIRAAEAALAHNPKFYAAHFNLAMALAAKAESAPVDSESSILVARARNLLDQALAVNPTYAPAHGLRGQLLARTGRINDALMAFEKASSCARDNPLWPLERAKLLIQLGRFDEAIELLHGLAVIEPGMVEVFQAMAEANLAAGRVEQARAALEHASRLRPHDANIALQLQQLGAGSDRAAPATVINR